MLNGSISTLAGWAAGALPIDMKTSNTMLLKKRNAVFCFICNFALLLENSTSLADGLFLSKTLPCLGECAKPHGADPDWVFTNPDKAGLCINYIANKVNKGLLWCCFFKKTLDRSSPRLIKFSNSSCTPVYLMEGGDAGKADKHLTLGNY